MSTIELNINVALVTFEVVLINSYGINRWIKLCCKKGLWQSNIFIRICIFEVKKTLYLVNKEKMTNLLLKDASKLIVQRLRYMCGFIGYEIFQYSYKSNIEGLSQYQSIDWTQHSTCKLTGSVTRAKRFPQL